MFINLFGLTLGLSVSIFILLFVRDELHYDQHVPGFEQIVRVHAQIKTDEGVSTWATSEGFIVPMISRQYPEIEAATRILRNDNEVLLKSETETFTQDGIVGVDSTFFQVFPFRFVYGDSRTAMQRPDGIVITQAVATKFFGKQDPVGKVLTSDNGPLTVTGVIEDVPPSSHFHFKIAFSLKSWWRDVDQARGAQAFYSYIRLRETTTPAEFNDKVLKDWYNRFGYVNDKGEIIRPEDPYMTLVAMPVQDIHLQSHGEKEYEANGQMQIVYIFIGVGILMMVIATINYINLSNAIAIKRAKEVAIRKTIGASQRRLFLNFIFESYAFSLAAFLLALVVVIMLIPQFNLLTGKQLNWQALADLQLMTWIFVAWAFLGFLAGFYPATILSSFDPIKALKSGVSGASTGSLAHYLRKGLIISQFAISSFMIVGAFTIQQQLDFIDSRGTGFNKSNVIILPLTGDARRKAELIKQELDRVPGVVSCGATSVVPGKRVVILSVRVPDLAGTNSAEDGATDGSRSMRVMSGDHNLVESLGLQLIEGRNFEDNASDSAGAFILNEAAVREFKLDNPIGRPFEYVFETQKVGTIIGVVKDFNFASVHASVEPLMIHVFPPMYSTLCVRIAGDPRIALEGIEKVWSNTTAFPFSYKFLDTTYDAIYRTERSTAKTITSFTVLALIIAGLGLFGIVSFFVTQRTKEVGVRKVFGATRSSLVQVLSREYVVMVVIGNLIAVYPAYFLVNQWLQQFAYHINLSFLTFVGAFLLSEMFAFGSIIFVILKTARANPSTILRHE